VLPTGKIWNKTLIFAECITNARTAYNEAVQALPSSAEFPHLMDGLTEQVSNLHNTIHIKLCHRNLKQKPQCIFNLQMKASATLWDSQLVASCAKLRGMTAVPPPCEFEASCILLPSSRAKHDGQNRKEWQQVLFA
jgi:hypothetical protein